LRDFIPEFRAADKNRSLGDSESFRRRYSQEFAQYLHRLYLHFFIDIRGAMMKQNSD